MWGGKYIWKCILCGKEFITHYNEGYSPMRRDGKDYNFCVDCLKQIMKQKEEKVTAK